MMKKDVFDDKLNIYLIDYDYIYGRVFFGWYIVLVIFGNFQRFRKFY